MRLFPKPLEIEDNDGFPQGGDLFYRQDYGKKMMRLLEELEEPIVGVLDGDWGSGKTTFVKMWCGLLRNNGFPVVYLDAFSSDYMKDAFCAVLSSFIPIYNEVFKSKIEKEKFISAAKNTFKIVTGIGAKIGIRIATANMLDLCDIEDVVKTKDTISSASSSEADKIIDHLFESTGKDRETIDSFKRMISDFPKAFCDKANNEASDRNVKPLIFVIDELDRCKPTFAVEILECVKHFFSVVNVHFVLVTNMQQLEDSICSIYGTSRPQLYLHKFYNLKFTLPELQLVHGAGNIDRYFGVLSKNLPQKTSTSDIDTHTLKIIKEMSKSLNLSFREIEKVVCEFAMFLHGVHCGFKYVSYIASLLCIIKISDGRLYKKINHSCATYGDILEFTDRFRNIFYYNDIMEWWEFLYTRDVDIEKFAGQRKWTSINWYGDKDGILTRHCQYFDALSFIQLT